MQMRRKIYACDDPFDLTIITRSDAIVNATDVLRLGIDYMW